MVASFWFPDKPTRKGFPRIRTWRPRLRMAPPSLFAACAALLARIRAALDGGQGHAKHQLNELHLSKNYLDQPLMPILNMASNMQYWILLRAANDARQRRQHAIRPETLNESWRLKLL